MRATIVLLLALLAASPQQTPRFAVSVNTTVIDAIVTDAAGNAISGLAASDFTLTVNGTPRSITAFTELQFAPDVTPSVEPPDPSGAIVTNRGFDGARLVVLVIDDSSPMSAVDALRVRPSAEAAVRSLVPGTLATVVFTSSTTTSQGFTTDRARLLKAVAAVRPRVVVRDPVLDAGLPQVGATGMSNASAADTSLDFRDAAEPFYRQVTATLRRVSEALRALPERQKAIVFISPGLPLDLSISGLSSGTDGTGPTAMSNEPRGVKQMILDETVGLIRAANDSRVTINSVDPGGLRPSVAQANREYLRGVSASTGGDAIVNTNAPAPALDRLWRSTRAYYLLGFETLEKSAANPKITLGINRPGATIRFRRTEIGRSSSAAPPESGLATALHGLLPATDLGLEVNLTPIIRSRADGAALAVAAGVSLPVSAASAGQHDTVAMSVNAYDLSDKPVASRQVTGRIALPTVAGTLDFDLLCRLDLKPGSYQLRIGVSSAVTGLTGSVFADIEVPDPASTPVWMSPVMLAAPGRLASPLDAFQDLLPLLPGNRRALPSGTAITVATALYQSGRRSVELAVSTRITRADESEVFGHTEMITADRFSLARSTIYETTLPTTLPPGTYIVEMDARGAGVSILRRTTRITIQPR